MTRWAAAGVIVGAVVSRRHIRDLIDLARHHRRRNPRTPGEWWDRWA